MGAADIALRRDWDDAAAEEDIRKVLLCSEESHIWSEAQNPRNTKPILGVFLG